MQAVTDKQQDRILLTTEVAELFRVIPKTVCRWVRRKELSSFGIMGGEYRFSWERHIVPFMQRREKLATWQEETSSPSGEADNGGKTE